MRYHIIPIHKERALKVNHPRSPALVLIWDSLRMTNTFLITHKDCVVWKLSNSSEFILKSTYQTLEAVNFLIFLLSLS